MNDRKLTQEEKLAFIQKIANDEGLYGLNKFLNEITFNAKEKYEEPPVKEEIVNTAVETNTPVVEVVEEKLDNKIQIEEQTDSIIEINEPTVSKEETPVVEKDDDPNTASIYRQDALAAVRQDLEEQKERVSTPERATEVVEEPTPVVEDKHKTLMLEKNDPWGTADGIKHVTPGQNI